MDGDGSCTFVPFNMLFSDASSLRTMEYSGLSSEWAELQYGGRLDRHFLSEWIVTFYVSNRSNIPVFRQSLDTPLLQRM